MMIFYIFYNILNYQLKHIYYEDNKIVKKRKKSKKIVMIILTKIE